MVGAERPHRSLEYEPFLERRGGARRPSQATPSPAPHDHARRAAQRADDLAAGRLGRAGADGTESCARPGCACATSTSSPSSACRSRPRRPSRRVSASASSAASRSSADVIEGLVGSATVDGDQDRADAVRRPAGAPSDSSRTTQAFLEFAPSRARRPSGAAGDRTRPVRCAAAAWVDLQLRRARIENLRVAAIAADIPDAMAPCDDCAPDLITPRTRLHNELGRLIAVLAGTDDDARAHRPRRPRLRRDRRPRAPRRRELRRPSPRAPPASRRARPPDRSPLAEAQPQADDPVVGGLDVALHRIPCQQSPSRASRAATTGSWPVADTIWASTGGGSIRQRLAQLRLQRRLGPTQPPAMPDASAIARWNRAVGQPVGGHRTVRRPRPPRPRLR